MARRVRAPRPAPRPRLREIELQGASVRYGRHWALRDVSFNLRAGERWLLVGANGAGKTVLLKLLRGDLWPTPTGRERRRYRLGRVWHEQPALAREHIAYLGPERQDRYERYQWNLPVAEVVATGLFETELLLERPTRPQRRAIAAALEAVGLAGLAGRRFLSLSYGQRRRVLLARALVRRPDVLLLDEALNGLDAASRRAFLRALRRAATSRTAWVLSSHRHADMPRDLTHAARLDGGRVRLAGPIAAVHTDLFGGPAAGRSAPREAMRSGAGASPAAQVLRLSNVALFRDYRRVISRFDWTIRAGEHWCITGPNGAGKSTLVALLYGDLWPALGGRIERLGVPRGAPIGEWKRTVGIVSPELQAAFSATACTVEEIVLSGLHSSIGLDTHPTARERARARGALQALGLRHLAQRRARELSYGQLRLALLARALVLPRRVLLLDEPLDGLDGEVRAHVLALIDRAVRGGAQLIIASHHPEDLPAYVNHIVELRAGRPPRVRARD